MSPHPPNLHSSFLKCELQTPIILTTASALDSRPLLYLRMPLSGAVFVSWNVRPTPASATSKYQFSNMVIKDNKAGGEGGVMFAEKDWYNAMSVSVSTCNSNFNHWCCGGLLLTLIDRS